MMQGTFCNIGYSAFATGGESEYSAGSYRVINSPYIVNSPNLGYQSMNQLQPTFPSLDYYNKAMFCPEFYNAQVYDGRSPYFTQSFNSQFHNYPHSTKAYEGPVYQSISLKPQVAQYNLEPCLFKLYEMYSSTITEVHAEDQINGNPTNFENASTYSYNKANVKKYPSVPSAKFDSSSLLRNHSIFDSRGEYSDINTEMYNISHKQQHNSELKNSVFEKAYEPPTVTKNKIKSAKQNSMSRANKTARLPIFHNIPGCTGVSKVVKKPENNSINPVAIKTPNIKTRDLPDDDMIKKKFSRKIIKIEKKYLEELDSSKDRLTENGYPKSIGAHVIEKDNIRHFLFNIPKNEIIQKSDYKIISEISKGSFGQVFAAIWKGMWVAVKKSHGKMTLEAMRSITREVNAYRKLRHPRVVKYYGVCLDPSSLSIITEYICGSNLFDALFYGKITIDTSTRIKLAIQLVQAVKYLHEKKNIIHRDLKTANLILDNENNLKLCDFGKSRELDSKRNVKLEENGGSPRYMAPECFISGNIINEKADIWSIGCCLIEIFGGPVPFQDKKNNKEIIQTLLIDKKTPSIPNWFHPVLKSIVCKCLEWNKEERPTTQHIETEITKIKPEEIEFYEPQK